VSPSARADHQRILVASRTGGVGLVPNAAQSWTGESEAILSTYRRSLGMSDRKTEAKDGAPDRVACAPLPLFRPDPDGWLYEAGSGYMWPRSWQTP
jgi:hypothetical protein